MFIKLTQIRTDWDEENEIESHNEQVTLININFIVSVSQLPNHSCASTAINTRNRDSFCVKETVQEIQSLIDRSHLLSGGLIRAV